MDEVFRYLRKIEIHHMRDAIDVNSARGHVSSNQYAITTLLETSKRLVSLILCTITVNTGSFDSERGQILCELVGSVLCPRKN